MKSLLCLLALSGCAVSSMPISPAEPLAYNCNVTIFLSKEDALKQGPVKERALITILVGMGSFNKSVAHSIEKHKKEACKYGADQAYIKETTDADRVSLVAFTFDGKRQEPTSPAAAGPDDDIKHRGQ